MFALKFVSVLFFAIPILAANEYFSVPDVTVEALKTGEFRVHIPDHKSISLFVPHVKLNEAILHPEPGDFIEVKQKTGDLWIATFPKSNIKVGDTVYLWVSVVVDNLGYRKDGLNATITKLLDKYPQVECVAGSTVYNGGKPACKGGNVIYDEFNVPQLDSRQWFFEQWIPTYTKPNFIFNSYQNRDDTRFINDGKLYLKPIALQTENEVRGPLNLANGCTSKVPKECTTRSIGAALLPPVRSAKITSKISFKYGKIDIRAKLPAGEWIFPVIQLEQKVKQDEESSPKIWIAYSRGNDVLIGSDQTDIGSRLLFGGPVLHPIDPLRSKHLVSIRGSNPFYSQFHVYSLEWIPGKMTFKIDEAVYGTVDLSKGLLDDLDFRGGGSHDPEAPYHTEYQLSLGVAVGGLLDFPDSFTSGAHSKPWSNTEQKFVKSFFEKKSEWGSTWHQNDVALQVDYVRVTAV